MIPRRVPATRPVLAALVLAATPASFALDIPQRPQARVNDYAAILEPARRAALEQRLAAFERETSTQIVVVVFPSLEDESLEDFTNRLFERWRLGQKEANNGVLFAVFMKERRARIEVGYGLEGRLTDALSARILSQRLAPAFRERRYGDGVEAVVAAIEQAVRGEFTGADPDGRRRRAYRTVGKVALLILVGLVVLVRILTRGIGPVLIGSGPRGRRGRYGMWGGTFGGFGGGGGGGSWGGGGGLSGGGGFSGGGGSSGGGGASGGW